MNKKTILLVDDDKDLLDAMQIRCESIGLKVQTAHNLLTAMSLVEKGAPDLFCLDVNMPTGNGLEFCEFLAKDPQTVNIPVIVLTGENGAETVSKCGRLRAHHVPKNPRMWRALAPLIRSLVDIENIESPKQADYLIRHDATAFAAPHSSFESYMDLDDECASQTVVIADDDPDIVQILTHRFGKLGCTVIGTRSAIDALNVISKTVPDLVCLDVNMPAGNGLTVCEMMRNDKRLADIPVIMLTGRSDNETIRRCNDLMAYYVEKSANVWERVEPLARELLAVDSTAC